MDFQETKMKKLAALTLSLSLSLPLGLGLLNGACAAPFMEQ